MQPPSTHESVAELTLRAVVSGIVFGVLYGAANAYLGLRVGLTVSTSIPIAVLTVAAFRFMRPRPGGMMLEANLSQTIGSASSSLASGTIFTIPALFLWGMAPPFWQVAVLAFLGAILGISAMVPLRRLLIVKCADELPYPEGTACAEVLRATATESSGGRWIFIGLAVGAVIKLALGAAALIPSELHTHVIGLPKAELTLEIAPALLGVGYILGYRQSASGVRLLGRGRHGAPPGQGVHVRLAGAPRSPGHADEDGDRRRARRRSPLGAAHPGQSPGDPHGTQGRIRSQPPIAANRSCARCGLSLPLRIWRAGFRVNLFFAR